MDGNLFSSFDMDDFVSLTACLVPSWISANSGITTPLIFSILVLIRRITCLDKALSDELCDEQGIWGIPLLAHNVAE